jgi:hypothetical protein
VLTFTDFGPKASKGLGGSWVTRTEMAASKFDASNNVLLLYDERGSPPKLYLVFPVNTVLVVKEESLP